MDFHDENIILGTNLYNLFQSVLMLSQGKWNNRFSV